MALTTGFPNGPTTQQIWLDSLQCTGTELTLASCPHQPFGVHDCSHIEDVGVRCQTVTGRISVWVIIFEGGFS